MTAITPKAQLIRHCTEAASTTHAECAEILATKDHDGQVTGTQASLAGCGLALVDLLSRHADIVHNLYQNNAIPAPATPASTGEQEVNSTQKYDLALKRLEDVASIAYAKFYAYLFKDLPVCWRQLYTDARILKFCLLFLKSPYAIHESDGCPAGDVGAIIHEYDDLDELVKTLDLALILAGAPGERRGRVWIDKALELLQLAWLEVGEHRLDDNITSSHGRPAKRAKLTGDRRASDTQDTRLASATFSTNEPFTPPVTHPVKTVEALSMEQFQTYMDRPHDPDLGPEPLILRNALNDWPALSTRPWNQPSYLLSQTFDGRRLVPVEIGRSYVDEGWGQKLVTFGAFLHEHMEPASPNTRKDSSSQSSPDKGSTNQTDNTKPIAYLAQHQLFAQLPALRNDILIPDYCYTAPPPHPTDPRVDQPELAAPLLNAWFGPPGTISPLHNDPYHNVLAQVVGRKYVRLYAPRDTARLAARGKENGVEMGNTSMLDVGVLEGWDRPNVDAAEHEEEGEAVVSEEDLEAFKTVPFVDCILGPGDALYIPIGWWHYVRGLSVSFSVSFWWN